MDWASLHGSFFSGSRILVTGGAGFIGSHLAEALDSLGASVVVLDDLSGGDRSNVETFRRVQFVEGSILNGDFLASAMRGCDYVLHQAALGSVPRSVEHPRLYHDVNITGTLNVLEMARACRVRRVLFAASSSAYGSNPVPWIEKMPVLPLSPYAATKVSGEALLRVYSASYGLDAASLRYFNIFGPRQNANSAYAAVIAAFAKALLNDQRPVIFGDGEQSRDFTFVYNAVHANLLALRRPEPLRGEVMNVGCGRSTSVNELARLMSIALEKPQFPPLHKAGRTGDLKHSFADLVKCRTLIGYEPIVDFNSGLQETVQWYRTIFNSAVLCGQSN
jgi:nucleoside-diphosphate-sugar epimerase